MLEERTGWWPKARSKARSARGWAVRHSLGLVALTLVVSFLFGVPSESRVQALAPFAWPLALVLLAVLLHNGLTSILEAIAYWVRERLGEVEAKTTTGTYRIGVKPSPSKAQELSDRAERPRDELINDDDSKVVLATLWKYQKVHGTTPGVRWTYHPVPGHAAWKPFLRACGSLFRHQLVDTAPTGQIYLTDQGLSFVKEHETQLGEPPRELDPFADG
mgnify:CR=1 FL=1